MDTKRAPHNAEPAMWRTYSQLMALALGLCAGCTGVTAEPVRAGWTEVIHLPGLQAKLNAKLDTGAKTSALGAQDLKQFQRGGREWISFTLAAAADRTLRVEREVVRFAKIRRAGVPTETRPVISLMVCVAGIMRHTQFTVNNRRGMAYPVLLGRRFLAGRILVDAAAANITSRSCPPQ